MAVIITENFNDIPAGDLNDDPNWTADGGWDVSATLPYEGAMGIEKTGDTEEYAVSTGTQCDDGKQTFYWQTSATGTGEDYFFLTEDGNIRIYLDMRSTAKLRTYYNAGYVDLIDPYSADHYYEITIEWRSSDHKAKITIDEVLEQDWEAVHTAWTNYLDGVKIGAKDNGATYTYFDTFQEDPYSAVADVAIMFGCDF